MELLRNSPLFNISLEGSRICNITPVGTSKINVKVSRPTSSLRPKKESFAHRPDDGYPSPDAYMPTR